MADPVEESNQNSEFWSTVEDFARNIPKFWCQFGGNKRAMLKRHHTFFYKDRPIGDLIQNQIENMDIDDPAGKLTHVLFVRVQNVLDQSKLFWV